MRGSGSSSPSPYKCHTEESYTPGILTKWKSLALLHCFSHLFRMVGGGGGRRKSLWIFTLGHCQTTGRLPRAPNRGKDVSRWRESEMGVFLTGTIVLSLDFKLFVLFSSSLLIPALHSSCWQSAPSLSRKMEDISTSRASFYLASSSSICLFSIDISPSGFSSRIYLPLLFLSFMRLFLVTLLFLYSVVSGKNRTWMHVLSPPSWTWRWWTYVSMLLFP